MSGPSTYGPGTKWVAFQRIPGSARERTPGSDGMVPCPRRSPRSTPTAAAAPPVPHDDSARRRHTSGSPIVEEPRLANMSYNACKAAATAKAERVERLKKVEENDTQ